MDRSHSGLGSRPWRHYRADHRRRCRTDHPPSGKKGIYSGRFTARSDCGARADRVVAVACAAGGRHSRRFLCGLAFSRIAKPQMQSRAERTQEAARALFETPIFFLFGLAAPLDEWADLGWRGASFVLLLLLFRRLPWIFLAAPATGFFRGWHEKTFVGWFGPIGVAAIFYAAFAERHAPGVELWPIASLAVMASIVVHGALATPASVWMRRGWAAGRTYSNSAQ